MCLILSGNAVRPRPIAGGGPLADAGGSRGPLSIGPSRGSEQGGRLPEPGALRSSQGTGHTGRHQPMTLAGGVPWSQWAFCHIINRWAVGPLFLLGHSLPHRPEGPPLGSLCPPHAAGPATRPERRECGQPHPCSRLEPSPGRWPHLLPPHLTRRECLRRARQKQPSPPPPTHGGEDDPWRAVPPETHCPATPCSARWLEGTGGETHPQPRARSWGKEGVGQGQPPPPFLRSQGPHHLSLGPGSWGTCSSVPHSPPHLHPPQALARPTLLPLLANLRLMEMSCLKLSPSPN